ncbi:very short patch repair endonuclease [Roseovarius indicus]|uniref:very short patch repair endonuclease n=1 Tax=Roseovarius indicus TaxID=540747 RepID=UPI004058F7DE
MKTKRRPLTRSENMARIRSKDTKPEMVIRQGLHARGYRFRLHRRDLPGTPDLVLPKHGAVVEVRGCYWHAHPGCGRAPSTNQEYWGPKLKRNRERDLANEAALQEAGWRVLIVWECCMVGKGRWSREDLLDAVEAWLVSEDRFTQLEGRSVEP